MLPTLPISLHTPAALALALLAPAVLLLYRWRPTRLRLPRVRLVKDLPSRRHLRGLPATLFTAGICMLALAAAGPYLSFGNGQSERTGCAITVALDISKSMLWAENKDKVKPDKGQPDRFQLGCALIRTLAKHCESNSPGDLIQVLVFDEGARVAITFTGDFKQIYRKVDLLALTRGLDDDLDGGTNLGGKGPGPIEVAVEEFNAIKAPHGARRLIVVTDGDDKLDESTNEAPNRERLQHLLIEHGVKMDVVGVGPVLARGEADIVMLSYSAGGTLYTLGTNDQTADFLAAVKAFTRKPLPGDQVFERVELFRIFAALGAVLMLGWLWSESRIFNS